MYTWDHMIILMRSLGMSYSIGVIWPCCLFAANADDHRGSCKIFYHNGDRPLCSLYALDVGIKTAKV